MPKIKKTAILVLFVSLAASYLQAHDFWIEAAKSSASEEAPGPVTLQLFVGDGFQGEPFPRDPSHVERFVALGPDGELPVGRLSGRFDLLRFRRAGGRVAPDHIDPAGWLLPETPGLYVVGYQSRPSETRMTAGQFEEHLHQEGLEAKPRRHGHHGVDEKFSRSAKTLLSVGGSENMSPPPALGLTLEIVTEKNPFSLSEGEELPVRVLLRGKPLKNARITAVSQGRAEKFSARSDDEGRIAIPLSEAGMWMIKCIYLEEAEEGADWESYWASLTFHIPDTSSGR